MGSTYGRPSLAPIKPVLQRNTKTPGMSVINKPPDAGAVFLSVIPALLVIQGTFAEGVWVGDQYLHGI